MSDSTNLGMTATRNQEGTRLPNQDLEVWKHFAGAGATDKNTMITVVSWLLGLLAGLIGYIASHPEELKTLNLVLWVGLGGSVIAAYLALLYGGYANRNWAKADQIACRLSKELVTNAPSSKKATECGSGVLRYVGGRGNDFAWWLAKPCDPENRLPPIFWWYAAAALSCAGIFVYYLAQ